MNGAHGPAHRGHGCCPGPLRPLAAWAQFDSVLKSSGAAEQLRLGVQSYHRGRYAESILLFEKALAYAPGDALIEYWLGRAYLKSGYEETALRVWQPLSMLRTRPPFLKAKAEALRGSRAIAPSGGELSLRRGRALRGQKGKDDLLHPALGDNSPARRLPARRRPRLQRARHPRRVGRGQSKAPGRARGLRPTLWRRLSSRRHSLRHRVQRR